MQKTKTDEALSSELEMELVEGEELLWAGMPDPMSVALSRKTLWEGAAGLLFLLPVLFIFGNFFPMFSFGSSLMPTPSLFTILPLVFLGVGLWQIASPLRAYVSATRTLYGVTSNRAMIVKSLFSRSVKSYGPHQIEFLETSVNANGTGNIIFDRETHTRTSRSGRSGMRRTRTYTVDIGFFGVQNPREVEALMLRTFTQMGSGTEKPKRGLLQELDEWDPLKI